MSNDLVLGVNWLVELLNQNRSIHMRDGLGTFISKTSYEWTICGRDDVMDFQSELVFYDLATCLIAAKSLKARFLEKNE